MDTTLSMPNIFCILVVEIELLSLPCDAADSSVSRMGCDSSILFLYVGLPHMCGDNKGVHTVKVSPLVFIGVN